MQNINGNLSTGWRQCYLKIVGLMLLFISLAVQEGVAQEEDRIKVKVGGKIGSRDFTSAAYRFPAFQEGIIYYNSAVPAKASLNFNQLLGEMHFISPKGDTLALDNLYQVKVINIGEAKFYYDPANKSFGEVIADFNTVKLLITHRFRPSDKESGVAYDQYSNTSATTKYGTYTVNGRTQKLNINEYQVFAKRANYFISDQNNQFHLVNKGNILKIFSKHKAVVEKYIKDNRTDFQKEEDLKKLLSFCTQLT